MKTVTEHIREHLLRQVMPPRKLPPLDELREKQWCDEYETYRRNRMILGAFRYGLIEEQDYNRFKTSVADRAIENIEAYKEDGNLEHLIDAGNQCMIAFINGQRLGQVMSATDDSDHHEERIR